MKKVMLMLLFISFMIPQLPMHEASALSCASKLSNEEAYEHYNGIVVAKVDKLVERGEYNELQITVSKSYKGITDSKLTFIEDKTWGAINGPSVVGEEYLFFLKGNENGWENPLCAPSEKTDRMIKELAFLKDKELDIISSESDVIPDKEVEVDINSNSPIEINETESFIESNTYKIIISSAVVAIIGIIVWVIMPQRKRK